MRQRRRTARTPAKVNLSLRILGRRDDGYHELETVFQAIDLWDELDATESDRLTLRCDAAGLPVDGTNLVLRAARALQDRCGRDAGAEFFLRKSIPVGGGLGGGSADAAAALILLRELWSLTISDRELVEIAGGLGSDVPFFLTGGTALGAGRGERVEPLPFYGAVGILLGIPPFGIATPEVYARLRARLTPPGNDVRLRRFVTLKLPGGKDFSPGVNDLEAVVLEGWPELVAPLSFLRKEGAAFSLVSGSGSSVFGVFEDPGSLPQAAAKLRSKCPTWTWLETRAIEGRTHIVESPAGAMRGREGG